MNVEYATMTSCAHVFKDFFLYKDYQSGVMMQTSSQPEFIKTIGEIKGAEEEYDRLILEAKEKADRVLREAKEKVADERAKSSEGIVRYKNEQLRAGSSDIESEVKGLIDKAKKESSKTSGKILAPAAVGKLVKDFLGSL